MDFNLNIKDTFIEYVGKDFKNYNITNRQKDAIEKLLQLPNIKFNELCEDIVNELKNRQGHEDVDTTKPMFEKLAKLSDSKLKNLIIDILLVYNYRFEENNASKETLSSSMTNLNDIEIALKNLKEIYSIDQFKNEIKNLNFINKVKEYINYTSQYIEQKEIVAFMQNEIDNEIKSQCDLFFEVILYPDILFKKLDEKDMVSDEIKNYLDIAKSETNPEKFTINYNKLIETLTKDIKPYKQVFVYNQEINTLCTILKNILTTQGEAIDFEKLKVDSLLPTIDSILKKSTNCDDDEMNNLKMYRFLVEGLNNIGSTTEGLTLIVDIARNVHKIVKKSISITE